MQEESRLLNYLMGKYDREVRPVYNASKPVVVRVGITLTQIFDMVRFSLILTHRFLQNMVSRNYSEGLDICVRLCCDQ